LSSGNDSGGTYVNISDYILPIVNTINPIIGNIEFAAYSSTGTFETTWETLPILSTLGDPMKLYVTLGSFTIVIRELDALTGLVAAEVERNITITSVGVEIGILPPSSN